MADYTATGAGTAAADGTYVDSGTYNGARYYDNGAYKLWWNSGASAWYISGILGSPGNLYNKAGTPVAPSVGTYNVGMGAAPAPDVSGAGITIVASDGTITFAGSQAVVSPVRSSGTFAFSGTETLTTERASGGTFSFSGDAAIIAGTSSGRRGFGMASAGLERL